VSVIRGSTVFKKSLILKITQNCIICFGVKIKPFLTDWPAGVLLGNNQSWLRESTRLCGQNAEFWR
jgi:hypothetical protein